MEQRVICSRWVGWEAHQGRTREFQCKVQRPNRFFLIVWPLSCPCLPHAASCSCSVYQLVPFRLLERAEMRCFCATPLEGKAKADSWFLHRDMENIVSLAALSGGAAIKWSSEAESGHINVQGNCLQLSVGDENLTSHMRWGSGWTVWDGLGDVLLLKHRQTDLPL